MSRCLRIIAMLALASACAKKPPEPDPIGDLSRRIRYMPKSNLAQFDSLARALEQGKPAPKEVQTLSSGTPLVSMAELTAMIRKAGYTPHPDEPGFLPYFEAVDSVEAATYGLPHGLQVLYTMPDSGSLMFVAVVRPLRGAEEPSVEQMFQEHTPMAADLLAKLRSITPFPGTAVFAASAIPTGMSGTTEIRRARLLLVVRLVNKSSDPTIPVVVVAMMLQALHDTRSVWQ